MTNRRTKTYLGPEWSDVMKISEGGSYEPETIALTVLGAAFVALSAERRAYPNKSAA
jgi:hypothetical protein